ncbi:MAG: carboxylating nicotinate-nucleotide diphosphorylase, partial [Patescibacteria group bacterium]
MEIPLSHTASKPRQKPWFKTHNQINLLTLENPVYVDWIFKYTADELKKDLGGGDITTERIAAEMGNHGARAKAKIVFHEAGIAAGGAEIEYFLTKAPQDWRLHFGDFTLHFFHKDGEEIKAGEAFFEIEGAPQAVLGVERTVLNLVGRMSSVATVTQRMVRSVKKINPAVLVTPTRKTLWGWLDKRASALGGGGTHRLNLADAILIKDNHLALVGRNVQKALRSFFPLVGSPRFIEIEVWNKEEALESCIEFQKLQQEGLCQIPCFIMLDNATLQEADKIIRVIEEKNLRKVAGIEVSGGIHEKNIEDYAKTGADIISLGSLTHSVK